MRLLNPNIQYGESKITLYSTNSILESTLAACYDILTSWCPQRRPQTHIHIRKQTLSYVFLLILSATNPLVLQSMIYNKIRSPKGYTFQGNRRFFSMGFLKNVHRVERQNRIVIQVIKRISFQFRELYTIHKSKQTSNYVIKFWPKLSQSPVSLAKPHFYVFFDYGVFERNRIHFRDTQLCGVAREHFSIHNLLIIQPYLLPPASCGQLWTSNTIRADLVETNKKLASTL